MDLKNFVSLFKEPHSAQNIDTTFMSGKSYFLSLLSVFTTVFTIQLHFYK